MQAWRIAMQDEGRYCLLSSELKYCLQAGQVSEASPELAEAAAAAAS